MLANDAAGLGAQGAGRQDIFVGLDGENLPRTRRAMLTQYRRPNTTNRLSMLVPTCARIVPLRRYPATWLSTTESRITIRVSGRE